MKFLFKVIVLPILIALAIPVLLIIITYKDFKIPMEDFDDLTGDQFQLTEMVQEQMDLFLSSNSIDDEISIGFSQGEANELLLTQFRTMNENFLVETAPENEKSYVMYQEITGTEFGYQGTFVKFKDQIVEIESGVHLKAFGFTYKTSLLITLKLTIDTDEIILKLEKLNIGNLPLAWTFSTASWLTEQVLDKDLEQLINENIEGFATFDPKKREIKVDIQALIAKQFEEDPQSQKVISALLGFIKENELVDIGFKDGEFAGSLKLGRLRDDSATLTVANPITSPDQLQSIFAAKASSLIFSTLSTTSDPFIELDQMTLNRVFQYLLKDNLTPEGYLMQTDLVENYQINVKAPYITMDTVFKVNIPIEIVDKEDSNKIFKTIIKLDALPEVSGNDLLINLNSLQAGEVTLDGTYIADILALIGDNEAIVDGKFVISDFNTQMAAAGMNLTSVQMIPETDTKAAALRLYVQLDNSVYPIDDIVDAITNILDELTTNPDIPEEVQNAVQELIDNLDNPEDLEAAIEDLINTMGDLDEEELETLYNELLEALGDDYSSIFDLLE